MPKYTLLVMWNDISPQLFEGEHDSYESLLDFLKEHLRYEPYRKSSLYYLRWEPGIKNSFWVGSFNSKELEAKEEAKEEDFTPFLPYQPLPRDENDDPYFPPSEGILVANYEVRLPNEKRLQFIDREDSDDQDGSIGSQKEI